MNTNLSFLNFFTTHDNKFRLNPDQGSGSSRLPSIRKTLITAKSFMDHKPRNIMFGLVLALLMAFILQPSSILAQTCNNVTLRSQAQINDIASSCSVIRGNLTIRETTAGDIVDLTPLRGVDIENLGNCDIGSNSMLESLDGLEGLKSIGSSITIYNNPSLKNVEGLVGMEQMRGYIYIYNNDSLVSINGFRNVTKNPQGFNGLGIYYNPALTSLDGLEGLKKWDDYIEISENERLKDVDGLQGLIGSSRSSIGIYDNPALMNIDGLQNLATADYIYIGENPMLINTDGLKSLTTVDYFEFWDNAILADFCGLYPFFSNNVNFSSYFIGRNLINPTSAEIIADGPCSPVGSPRAICIDVNVSADANCEAAVTAEQVDIASYDPGGDPITLSISPAGPYGPGDTEVTLTVTNLSGKTDQCSATVSVVDDAPPVLTATATPIIIYPPNHKYETIDMSQLVVSVADNCALISATDVYITSVTSDEVENDSGDGDGNTVDDIVISSPDCDSVNLRRERDENGNGRVYTIYLAVDDGNGNTATASVQVHVPVSNGGTATDDGPVYEEECNKSSLATFAGGDIQLMNYPNPFNGSTTITFTLGETENTTLKVYDTFGKEVATLFDGMAESGQQYALEFKGENLSKGMYVYHLQSGNNVSVVKKMLLMK